MAMPQVITTRLDLAKFIRRVLGNDWYVSVSEKQSDTIASYGQSKCHEFAVYVSLDQPMSISVWINAKTFPALVKAVDGELWEKIRAEFVKKSATWGADPDLVTQKKPAIESKSTQKKLTHKKVALPAPSKQLLLLPPATSCCNWPGCTVELQMKSWGCMDHWIALPRKFQELISLTYRPDRPASNEYLEVMGLVRQWISTQRKALT